MWGSGRVNFHAYLPKLGPTADRCGQNLRSGIMRNQEWDTALAKLDALDLAELVLGLLILDAVDGETALGVVDETEVLASLLDGDDIHEAGGVGDVGADLAIDLDEALHHDGLGLTVVERILEAVAHEDNEGHALAELVRTSGRAGSIDTRQLVEKPVRGGAKALLVLLPAVGSQSQSFTAAEKLRFCDISTRSFGVAAFGAQFRRRDRTRNWSSKCCVAGKHHRIENRRQRSAYGWWCTYGPLPILTVG